MADQMIVGLGLNDDQFRVGLARAEAQSAKSAREFEKHWHGAGEQFVSVGRKLAGIGGGMAGVALGVWGARGVVAGFREATEASEEFHKLWSDPHISIDPRKQIGGWLERRAEANDIGGLASAARMSEAAKQSVEDDKALLEVRRQLKEASVQMAQAEAAIAEAQGQPGRAASLKEMARHEQELLSIRGRFNRGGSSAGPLAAEDRLHRAMVEKNAKDDIKRERELFEPWGDMQRGLQEDRNRLLGSDSMRAAAVTDAQKLAAELQAIDEQFGAAKNKLEDNPFFKREELGNFADVAKKNAVDDLLRNRELARRNASGAFGRDQAKQRDDADARFDAERRTWDIEQLRLDHREKEADLAEIELGFDKKRLEIWKQDFLPESERNRRIDIADKERDQFLKERRDRDEKVLGGLTLQSGGIGLGGGGGELLAQVLGGGTGTNSVPQQQLEQQRAVVRGVDDTNSILERIERKIGPVTAVLG